MIFNDYLISVGDQLKLVADVVAGTMSADLSLLLNMSDRTNVSVKLL